MPTFNHYKTRKPILMSTDQPFSKALGSVEINSPSDLPNWEYEDCIMPEIVSQGNDGIYRYLQAFHKSEKFYLTRFPSGFPQK